jgi:hypothetical protein
MTVILFMFLLFLLIMMGASVKLEGGIEIGKQSDDRQSKRDREEDGSS